MASTHKSAVASNAELTVKHAALGNTLVDASGRTLYLFQADKPNVSVLSRSGLSVWPAFAANRKPRAAGGVNAARIGTIAAPGGTRQVTYDGHPLYYYVGDRAPGAVNGQDLNQFGARWYVVSSNGRAVTTAPAMPTSSAATPSGSTY
jgi:predicted lipoprotein with Yx(FWY)xxD motif